MSFINWNIFSISLEEIVYPIDYTDFNRYSAYFMAQTCPNLKKITFPSVEKKHNIKISVEDYDVFVKDCPNVTLGYVNFDMIKNQYKNLHKFPLLLNLRRYNPEDPRFQNCILKHGFFPGLQSSIHELRQNCI